MPPSSPGRIAATGTTVAALNTSVAIAACTAVPGFNRSPGLSTWIQTWTVVVLGSAAGLTTVTLPSTSSLLSGCVRVAVWPTFTVEARLAER